MDVLTAVITAEGDQTMTSAIENAIPEAFREPAEEQKADKKPSKGKQKGGAASPKPKAAKKATAKKPAKAAKPKQPKAEKNAGAAREGSKAATVLGLLQRAKGSTLAEIMEATGWQAHSVRGFISGTLGKKMGLKVESAKRDDGARVYTISK